MSARISSKSTIQFLVNDLANAYRDARAMPHCDFSATVKERENNLLRAIRLGVRTPDQVAEDKADCDRILSELFAAGVPNERP